MQLNHHQPHVEDATKGVAASRSIVFESLTAPYNELQGISRKVGGGGQAEGGGVDKLCRRQVGGIVNGYQAMKVEL